MANMFKDSKDNVFNKGTESNDDSSKNITHFPSNKDLNDEIHKKIQASKKQKKQEYEKVKNRLSDYLKNPERYLRQVLEDKVLEDALDDIKTVEKNKKQKRNIWTHTDKFNDFSLFLVPSTMDLQGSIMGKSSQYFNLELFNEKDYPNVNIENLIDKNGVYKITVKYKPYDELGGAGLVIPKKALTFGELFVMTGPGQPFHISDIFHTVLRNNSNEIDDSE